MDFQNLEIKWHLFLLIDPERNGKLRHRDEGMVRRNKKVCSLGRISKGVTGNGQTGTDDLGISWFLF